MAQLVGKWKGEPSGFTNYDAFCKASGMPDDIIEQFRNATNFMDLKRDGDNWTMDFKSDATPSRTYNFQSGKEVDSTDPFDKKIKFTITIESDTKMSMVEKSELMGWKAIRTSYEVKGDKLIGENVLPCGTKMGTEMTRC